MNEKLKTALEAWDDEGYSLAFLSDIDEAEKFMGPRQARNYALLAAALRGEIPIRRLLNENSERDAVLEADAARWNVVKPGFKIMSPKMNGQHVWTWGHRPKLIGPNIEAAADAALSQENKHD